ncbi:tryptophanyl-tRNA synthetase [Nematocida sp. ERTm5]|nr:tryptophanyl-tRNA synthetase [Nematocida sp. ERTm5]
MNITPWEVTGTEDGNINYNNVIEQFGCQAFTPELAQKYELNHILFTRGIVFAHRDFIHAIESFTAANKPIYLYTGRGPSSGSMHLGHAVAFLLCKYLQDRFKCKLVIQITDDEKYIWKNLTLDETINYGRENAKDIAAFGFDPNLTYIFSNTLSSHLFIRNILTIEKTLTLKDMQKVFGLTESAKVGQIAFPVKQIAPCYATSFPEYLDKDAICLIPSSIDQDPYFRLARDISHKLNGIKPCSIYTYFLPALQGACTKMSASAQETSIYLSDTPAMIKKKIMKYAFSGGQATLEEHRELGGNPDVDVAYQYLKFFMEDDDKLAKLKEGYIKGEILSGEMKKVCIEVLQKFTSEFQQRRSEMTDERMSKFYEFV